MRSFYLDPLFRAGTRLSAGSAPVLLTPIETAGLGDIASGADAKRWASDYLDRSQARPVDARLSEVLAAPDDLSTARALADVARVHNIPWDDFSQVLHGVRMDLTQSRYRTFDELRDYCYKVASVVGLIFNLSRQQTQMGQFT